MYRTEKFQKKLEMETGARLPSDRCVYYAASYFIPPPLHFPFNKEHVDLIARHGKDVIALYGIVLIHVVGPAFALVAFFVFALIYKTFFS